MPDIVPVVAKAPFGQPLERKDRQSEGSTEAEVRPPPSFPPVHCSIWPHTESTVQHYHRAGEHSQHDPQNAWSLTTPSAPWRSEENKKEMT